MEFWEKVIKDLEESASTISEKASDWLKVGTEKIKEGAGYVSEKTKDVSRLTRLKWSQYQLNQELQTAFTGLGESIFSEWTTHKKFPANESLKEKIDGILKLEASLDEIEVEMDELNRSLTHNEYKEMEQNLEKGGATIKQVVIQANASVCGKMVKELILPAEVLLGTIIRGEETIIPKGNTELKEGDKVTLMGKKDEVAATVEMFTE